jgi:hypothetical protein
MRTCVHLYIWVCEFLLLLLARYVKPSFSQSLFLKRHCQTMMLPYMSLDCHCALFSVICAYRNNFFPLSFYCYIRIPSIRHPQDRTGAGLLNIVDYETVRIVTYIFTGNCLLLLLYLSCTTNHSTLPFRYLFQLLVQGHQGPFHLFLDCL